MQAGDLFRLTGKTAVVTGGTSRFGAPIARALAQAGARVVITSRSPGRAQELAAQLRGEGLTAHALPLNLESDESIANLTKETVRLFGSLDILVNNAVGRGNAAELEELTREMVLASANVNMAGQIALINSVLPHMKRRGGGCILNISSSSALAAPKFSLLTQSRKNPANYMVEKCGLNGLTLWLAARYGRDNIRVNCLCPGTFDPGMFENPDNAEYIRRVREYNPIPRFMRAQEVAGPALFLVSPASSYCTGVILPVDGGYTI